AKTDSLVFTDNAGGSPHSIPLTGNGVAGTTVGGISFKGIAFGPNIAFGPGFATPIPPSQCGPPTFNCSTHSTAVATIPTRPTLAAVNSTAYAYSAPSDFFYPSS